MHDENVVLSRASNDLLEKTEIDTLRRRIRKPMTSIFGLGMSSRIARSSSAKKSTPGVMRTERMSAPAMIAP